MLSSVTSKGQVTIPKSIRDDLGIHPNDRVSFIREGNRVILEPIKTLKSFRGAIKTKGSRSFTDERAEAKNAVGKRVQKETA